MTAEEIYTSVAEHQIEGLMLHNELCKYFNFLGLKGFKKLHEKLYIEESTNYIDTVSFYIEHFNVLLPNVKADAINIIPNIWFDYTREEVDSNAKMQAVEYCMTEWKEWEKSTKEVYEKAFKELCEGGFFTCAFVMKELICRTDEELAEAENLYLMLKGIEFNMDTITAIQDSFEKEWCNA